MFGLNENIAAWVRKQIQPAINNFLVFNLIASMQQHKIRGN